MTLPSLRRPFPVTFPRGCAASSPPRGRSSTGSPAPGRAGGLLAVLLGWTALFVMLVGMPIAMLANGAEPAAVLGWMAMVAVSMAISWWLEGRRQAAELRRMPKPRRPTNPCAEAFQRRWGLAEEICETFEKPALETAWSGVWERVARWIGVTAKAPQEVPPAEEPVPLFIACESIGGDPNVLEAHRATVCDVLMDEMERAKTAGLSREDQIEHMVHVLRSAKPPGESGKPAARQGRISGGGQARLGRSWPRGYLGGR